MLNLKDRFKNIKEMKKNWNIVASNPYAHQKFMFSAYRVLIIFIAIVIIYQIVSMIINIKTGSNPLSSNLTKAFMVLVGAMMILKLYNMVQQMKKTLKHSQQNPINTQFDTTKQINIKSEVDEILDKYPVKGGKK